MKTTRLIGCLLASLAVQSCATPPATPPVTIEGVRTTSYTHNEKDHYKYGKGTAIGTTLVDDGRKCTAAADWSVFPLGTKFKIAGCDKEYVVEDYGSALVGTNTIDIYTNSRREMNKRGTQFVDITVTELGCYQASEQVLRSRQRYPHVRKMVSNMPKDPTTVQLYDKKVLPVR